MFIVLFQGHWRCDKFPLMPLTADEMKALRLLLREELQGALNPFRAEVSGRFEEMAAHLDGLYQRDERREQEYFSHPRTD